jgi:hypothetical protein
MQASRYLERFELEQSGKRQRRFDASLRRRVAESFDEFLKTLDAALTAPTPETLDTLRDEIDQVMQAIAGVRLEIERLATSKHRAKNQYH